MRQPYIKGKGELPAPSVMLEAADPDTMIQNIMSVAAKKIIAMGNAAHHGDEKDTKRLKDLFDIAKACKELQERDKRQNAYAHLSEEEAMAMLKALAQAKLKE